MTNPLFKCAIPALVTPFRNGEVDEKAFIALVERQIAGGVHGLVPAGTTGESATLSHDEHRRVVELCVKVAAGRVPAITGTRPAATFTHSSTTRRCSSWLKVADSPVVPAGTRPCTPPAICRSTRRINASSSTAPSANGVIKAGRTPWKRG